MKLLIVGLNHKTASVEVREKLAFDGPRLESGLLGFKALPEIEEALVLSTCNRVEIYTNVKDVPNASGAIKAFISGFHNLEARLLDDALYFHDDKVAVKPTFRVASSLDSMVVGEPQILGQMKDAFQFLKAGKMGKITAIHAHMYRNTPHGKPQWSRPTYPDMTPENILWSSFLGEAPKREFDANRYINWRFFWDYSGGNVYENMCHQISFWYRALELKIPTAVTMVGGVYLWKDGREVPDTMNVAMEHPEEMLFSWDSGFGNNQLGSNEDVLGTDGTLSKSQQIRYLPQKINNKEGNEMVGQTRSGPAAHMQNFFDCIRSGDETNCPFEVGFRVSIACRMSVESYRQGRTMRWDPAKEEMV